MQKPKVDFEYAFAEDDEEYSAFDDFEDEDEVEGSAGQLGPVSAGGKPAHYKPAEDSRPASERIASLFERLEPRKRVLFGILDFLDEPRRSDTLQEKVEQLQEHDFSVYSGYSYSALLFEAGAIEKVEEDGSPFDEEAEQAPDIVEIDGERFYKPTDGRQVFWVITQAGADFRAADNPQARLQALLQEDALYLPIYKQVLEECAQPGGKSAQDMAAFIDINPLCKHPRRWSAYFTKKLEDCEALVWSGSWCTTDLGKSGISLIDAAMGAEATDGKGEA